MNGRIGWLLLAGALLMGCTPEEAVRGYLPDPEDVKAIAVGTDTKDTVEKRLGNPTTSADYGDETWYYMTIYQTQAAFFLPEDVSRDILAVSFDKGGKVADVHHYTLADGRVVDFTGRETATRGRELTLLQQIFQSTPGTPINTNQNASPGGGGGTGPGN